MPVPLAEVLRNNDVKRLALRLIRRKTEDALASGIPVPDQAVLTGVENTVWRVGNEPFCKVSNVHRRSRWLMIGHFSAQCGRLSVRLNLGPDPSNDALCAFQSE